MGLSVIVATKSSSSKSTKAAVGLALAQLKAIGIEKLGLNAVERKGYIKLYQPGKVSGPCIQLWLDKAETTVTDIWLVNCTHDEGVPHKHLNRKGWYQSVQQQLPVAGLDVKELLNKFYKVAKDIAALAATPAASEEPASPAEGTDAVPANEEAAPEQAEVAASEA